MTETRQADASATRGFFIDMLVRDISIDDAILDLIDNSVDAARRIRPDGNLSDLRATVVVGADRFEIEDNCGGIPVETAEKYAFRFGRPDEFNPATAIGRFGIGLKRSVFRLGAAFVIESRTDTERFNVSIDVPEWRADPGPWQFPMQVEQRALAEGEEAGTKIIVTALHPGVVEHFSRDWTERRIRDDLMRRHSVATRAGFSIAVNGIPVDVHEHQLLFDANVTPVRNDIELVANGGSSVLLRLIAGIAPERRPLEESGWYVYCNGRLVLNADKTSATGWGTGDGADESVVPAWHPQYARFRGFVFFNSDDPGALPWTTTKTELDTSSAIYHRALPEMQQTIKTFVAFTNALRGEIADAESENLETPIRDAVASAATRAVDTVPLGSFTVPKRSMAVRAPQPETPNTTAIQFRRETDRVEALKKALNVKTNREVGEEAFDFLYEQEVGE